MTRFSIIEKCFIVNLFFNLTELGFILYKYRFHSIEIKIFFHNIHELQKKKLQRGIKEQTINPKENQIIGLLKKKLYSNAVKFRYAILDTQLRTMPISPSKKIEFPNSVNVLIGNLMVVYLYQHGITMTHTTPAKKNMCIVHEYEQYNINMHMGGESFLIRNAWVKGERSILAIVRVTSCFLFKCLGVFLFFFNRILIYHTVG